MTYPIEGECQCGAVKYKLLREPDVVVACHCRECQKLSTSAFSITAMIDDDALEITGEMKDWQRIADSGNVSAAKLCANCGNRIYHYDPASPSKLKLKPSTLSDTSIIQPKAHVWVSQKQDWFEIPDGAPTHETQPW